MLDQDLDKAKMGVNVIILCTVHDLGLNDNRLKPNQKEAGAGRQQRTRG